MSSSLMLRGVGIAGGPNYLPAGAYYRSDISSLLPIFGNYTRDAKLDDGNTATQVLTAGADMSILVAANAGVLLDLTATMTYNGAPTVHYYYGSGLDWTEMTDQGLHWTAHVAYQEETYQASFVGVPSALFWLMTFHTDSVVDGNLACDEVGIGF